MRSPPGEAPSAVPRGCQQTDGRTDTDRQTDGQTAAPLPRGGRAGGQAARTSRLRLPQPGAGNRQTPPGLRGCGARPRPPPHTMGTGAPRRGGRPTAAPQRPRLSPSAQERDRDGPGPGPGRLLPALRSPASTFCLTHCRRGAEGRRRLQTGKAAEVAAALPPPLPSLRPPPATTRLRIAGAAAESGSRCLCYASPGRSALLGEPGLQLLRLSSADCRLQGFALARPSLKCGSSHQPLPAALSGGRRRRHLPLSRRLPLFSLPSALRGDRRSCPPRSARVPGEPAAPLCDPRAGRGRGEAGLGRRATLPLGSP